MYMYKVAVLILKDDTTNGNHEEAKSWVTLTEDEAQPCLIDVGS